jgi:hypothetical protein
MWAHADKKFCSRCGDILNKKQVIGFIILIVGIACVVFAFESMNQLRENSNVQTKGFFNTGLTLIAVGTGLAVFCRRRIKRS